MPKGVYKHKKGYKRPPFSKEWIEKIREGSRGNKSHWKGDNAGYWARHRWLDIHVGRPRKCEHCGSTTAKRYEWANISGKYLRDKSDYIRLCQSCHIKFDIKRGMRGHTIKALKSGTFNDYNQCS